MSAMHHGDISLIRDEDLLKRMWQETEDFGKKKEIRSHMYRLRESRLKDLYNTSEVKGVSITTNTKSAFNKSTHADSLADHSFASLKSKEIRDSESPTRDVSYRITGSTNNEGWNISKIDERSDDGKTRRIVQTAQTSGSEVIPKGNLNFEAKCDQAITSFQDGDDKNFVRSQGLSSSTVMRQEAVGGDENSNFRSSTTKSSSSSKTTTEQKVSYDDSSNYTPHQQKSSNTENVIQKSVKVYETDAPQELKNHPGYVEGNTKITRETKTLADGTVVTTTKYETKGANEMISTSANQYGSSSSSYQQTKSNYTSSSSHGENYSSHKTIVDSQHLPMDQHKSKSRYYVEKTHTIPDNSSDVYQNTSSSRKTTVDHQTYKRDEQSKSDQTSNEKYEFVITADSKNDKSNRITHHDDVEKKTIRQEQYQENLRGKSSHNSYRIEDVKNERVNEEKRQYNTTAYQDVNSVPLGTPIEIEIDLSKIDINTKTIDEKSRKQNKTISSKSPERIDQSPRQKPIKPTESEWKTESTPTKGQYDTTYRTDYTTKRISVELSPTHDAFARSLRAVSPDRLSSRSSSRNLKTSTSSLRSSSSPEKTYMNRTAPSRSSPDTQRSYSPSKKTPDRLSNTETITYNSRPSAERTYPYSSQKTRHVTDTRVTSIHADVLTKNTKLFDDTNITSTTSSFTRKSPTKSPSRTSPPRKTEKHRSSVDITTDLDDNISTISNTTITKTERIGPSTSKYETTETVNFSKQTTSSPANQTFNKEKSPRSYDKKEKPIDRPLKRSDTYEERCRQILGITNETTERRRSSLEKLKRRGSSTTTTTEISSKDSSSHQQQNLFGKIISPSRSSPKTKDKPDKFAPTTKEKSQLQEFPAQIRRSPEKSPKHPSPKNEKSPEPYYNQESPSQSVLSPKEQSKVKNRRSSTTELTKNSKHKSPDKETKEYIVQNLPSNLKNSTANQAPKRPNDTKNKNVPVKQHATISVSVDNEIAQKNNSQKIENVNQVHPDAKKPVEASSISTYKSTSSVKDQPQSRGNTSITDDVNITFINQEVVNQIVNERNQSDNWNETQENIYKTTSLTKEKMYNQPTEETATPTSTHPKISTKNKMSASNKQIKENSGVHEINTVFIQQEVTNRRVSEDDQLKELNVKDSNAKVYIDEDTHATKLKQSDLILDKPTDITLASKSVTSKPIRSRETSPLKEYPAQIRRTSDMDDKNTKLIQNEITNRQVLSESQKVLPPSIPKSGKKPNTSQNVASTEIEENVCFQTSVTEASEVIPSDDIIIPKTNQHVNEDNYSNTKGGVEYKEQTFHQTAGVISVTGSTDTTQDKEKFVSNKMITKLIDKEDTTPKDRKPSLPQKNIVKEINTDRLESSFKLEKTPQQVPDSKKPCPSETITLHSTESELCMFDSKDSDTSLNASVVVEDILYINGDIYKNNTANENTNSENVLENKSRKVFIDSQDEMEITITGKKVITKTNKSNLQKQKNVQHKEQDVSRNNQPKRNVPHSQEKPLKKLQDKPSLVTNTQSNKDISKPKDKSAQRVINYTSKKSTTAQNVRNDLSKHIQNENVTLKKQPKTFEKVDSTSDGEVKEIHKKEYLQETYEGRTPVEEPLVVKKTISLLYSDDEDDKDNTQMLIESEIIDQKSVTEKRNDKQENVSKTTSKFIVNEKKETTTRTKQPISKSSPKSIPVAEKKPLTEKSYSRSKITSEMEYTDKNKKKFVDSKYNTNKRQNTLSDIEKFDDLKKDTSTHARFHRVDDNTFKPKSFTLKTETDKSATKTFKTVTSPKKSYPEVSKPKSSPRNNVVTEKNIHSVKPKSVETIQQSVKQTKPSTKVNHVVSTTILLKPKSTTSTVETASSKRKTDSSKTVLTKKKVKPEDSDDESIPDSLDENINNSVSDVINKSKKSDTKISRSTMNRSSLERKSPSRLYSQPDDIEEKPKVTKPKLEKRCISTKSIIINNVERGVTVDLQRSISSREPTPDRVCPLPVTSDEDENSPRYPDKVVEPEDTSPKRSHRLFGTVIQESEDGKEYQKIVEITEDIKQKVTEIDKVDRDDDSLLTVNKKISKFLTTADKLIEKPIMDISQPAPKVERQKFEVTEDLREDDCLLSVSDKVSKFINEAEHLTSHNSNQPRKSVNIDNKNDIEKKVSLTELKLTQGLPSKPLERNFVTEKNTPLRTDSTKLLDQNISTLKQDVFITTECDQIEKEQDLFRTTKKPSKGIHTQEQSTIETHESRESNFKPYSRRSKSPEKSSTETNTKEENIRETPNRKKSEDESPKKFTPKNRRPSQEEKVILSTVGRLRSSESIKKAKALFENKSSNNEIKTHRSVVGEQTGNSKDIIKRPIDRSTLTPKRLDFPTNEDSSSKQTTHKNSSVKHTISNQYKVDDREHIGPLKQQSPDREHLKSKDSTTIREPERRPSKERELPGYMKPLDRTTRPHSPVGKHYTENKIVDTQETEEFVIEEDIPGYMKPLDRTVRLKSPQREDQHPHVTHEHSTNEETREDVPGYMKPLSTHSHRHFSSKTDHDSKIHHKKNYVNASDIHQSQNQTMKTTDEIPGYMKPIKSHVHDRDYLQSEETHETHHSHDFRERDTTGDIPGYMKPIQRHIHQTEELQVSKTHVSDNLRGATHTDDLPGYMKPILSHTHVHEQEDLTVTDDVSEDKISNYRHLREHSPHKYHSPTSQEDKKFKEPLSVEDVPGYMKPLKPHMHEREYELTAETHHNRDFRQVDNSDDIPGYMKPIQRYTQQTEEIQVSKTHVSDKHRGITQTDDIPGYMKPILSHRHINDHEEVTITDEVLDDKISNHRHSRGHSPQKDTLSTAREQNKEPSSVEELPGYMKPLGRANRPQSPKREIPSSRKPNEPIGTPTKFGVTLKKTDSFKGITNNERGSKKHPILTKKNITEEEIEEVFDLEVLEELLLVVKGYELRRQIRTQIRTVKKLISEDKLELTILNIRNKNNDVNQSKATTRTEVRCTENYRTPIDKTNSLGKTIDRKPQRDTVDLKCDVESYQKTSSYARKESSGSLTKSESSTSRSNESPERRSPERKSPSRSYAEDSITKKSLISNRQSPPKTNGKLPQEPTIKTTNIFKSSLKKTEHTTKAPVNNSKPEWASQINLKKVTNSDTGRKTVTATSKTTKKESVRSSSPSKEVKPTDVITSSYGVGPTDENGTPLFGLRALRAQNKSISTKVQGTVVSSQYYSETGKEPVGQISVTKYSSDPRDLGSNENLTNEEEGILSITTTQKFGFDDAPSLKQLTNTESEVRDSQTERRSSSSKSSTVTRRNSVKALTQKFVENAVETSKSEQQSSYPKAGLILRSSSFKNESTTDASQKYGEITAEERTQKSMSVMSSNSRVVSGGTFLRNKTKVTGIQDVVTRMKAEDVEDGDTPEDIEARGLLNKYLGSQTILSGFEGQISKTTTTTARTASSSTAVKNTTKVTTVVVENGKEVRKTRIFEHPISNEVLDTVWDEQTLRYLLEQSTDYEERKSIRARLRLIMAEQEACTELVKQASQDQSGQSVDETTETNKEVLTEGPVTTTKVTSRVITQQTTSKKPISPFAKFRQLDKQNSLNTPPSTPRTPGGSPLFKFTDAALSQSASTIKDRLLYWCKMKTKEYENIQLDNFSSSWADGLAFCALIHHFLPNSFDYHALTPKERRHNFTLAFKVADEKADIAPLLDVDDMVATRKPDWKCVFTYVQSIYRRFKDED